MFDIYEPSVKYYLPLLLLGLTSVNKNIRLNDSYCLKGFVFPFRILRLMSSLVNSLFFRFHKVIVVLFVAEELFVFVFPVVSTMLSNFNNVGITKLIF